MSKKKHEPEQELVTRQDLERVIDGIEDLEPYRDFLKCRWVGMVMWWHERSLEARWKYFLLRGIIVVGGVMIPVLSVLNMNSRLATYIPIATAVVGAVIAGCAAWEGVANYGEIWREKRRAAELLKVEGWQFFQLCGKYEEDGNESKAEKYRKAFARFSAETENMIAKEVGEYLAVFDPSLVQARRQATEIADKIAEEVKRLIAAPAKP